MAKCKDCKYYKPINEVQGNCFGHEISADKSAEECPSKSFQLKENTQKKGKK